MMNTRSIVTFGLSALVLGGTTVGCAASQGMMAPSSVASLDGDAKRAAKEAANARNALAKHDADKAVLFAERAVAYDPRNADHRALLGQAYMMAGRFTSARDALTDALALDPANGRTALNLSLALIATGDWAGARQMLDTHAADIDESDRGLAYALAGDPVKAIEILAPAARAADASAKTRQNLALALALSGRWQEAKAVAAYDVPPDQLDQRIMDWAEFARPVNAYDQVASLLGVRAVADPGQPVQLALNSASTQMAAATTVVAPSTPVDLAPVATAEVRDPTLDVDVAALEPDTVPVVSAKAGIDVVFAPREEVVQAIPAARRAAPAAAPVRTASAETAPVARSSALASGNYYVQLGAFDSPGVARDAWKRVSVRYPQLEGHTPNGMKIKTGSGTFYRLSVGGFARGDADRLCGSIKQAGGKCFVRAEAGDSVASWAKPRGNQLAAR